MTESTAALLDSDAVQRRASGLLAWTEALPTGSVYASLYAAPETARHEVAAACASAGIPVHLDLILDRDERGNLVHRGVSPELVEGLAWRQPDAECEIHVILLERAAPGPEVYAVVAEILELAERARALRVALPAVYAEDADLTARFRNQGGAIWTVVSPTDIDRPAASGPPVEEMSSVSGALVMLIQPGTQQQARPELLSHVPALVPAFTVGVDGGIDSLLATRAISLGAHHVVVGRALLGATAPEHTRGEHS